MTTPKRPSRTLRERLRAMTGRSRPPLNTRRCHWCVHDEAGHLDPLHAGLCPAGAHAYEPARSRVNVASYEHTHRVVELSPPPRGWFVAQGITHADDEMPKRRKWFG